MTLPVPQITFPRRPRGLPGALLAALVILLGLVAPGAPASAQFAQYGQPGRVTTETPGLTLDQLELAMEEARWHLGPVRVEPWVAVRNLAYVDNPDGVAEGEDDGGSDLTANAGAGLKAYLPTGPRVIWSAHALPEYSFWLDRTERRRLNGRYGAGVFVFLNRLQLEATGTRTEELATFTPDLPRQVNIRRDRGSASVSLALGATLALFTEGSVTRSESVTSREERAEAPVIELLDRDETVLRGGVRYQPTESWTLGIGVERTETEFLTSVRDRSNQGTAPLLEIAFEGANLQADLQAAWRDLEAETGSNFVPYEDVTGSARLGWDGNRIDTWLYGRRNLIFAATEGYSYAESDIYGLSVTLDLGRRTRLRSFVERGSATYLVPDLVDPSGEPVPPRSDDTDSFGFEVTLDLVRSLRLSLGGTQSRLDSSLPGEDRTFGSVIVNLTLGAGASPWV